MSALNDCFTASGTRMTVKEAVEQFSAGLSAVTETESCELRAALGRVLAEDLTADRSIPPHNNAAVDGFAVFYDDKEKRKHIDKFQDRQANKLRRYAPSWSTNKKTKINSKVIGWLKAK